MQAKVQNYVFCCFLGQRWFKDLSLHICRFSASHDSEHFGIVVGRSARKKKIVARAGALCCTKRQLKQIHDINRATGGVAKP